MHEDGPVGAACGDRVGLADEDQGIGLRAQALEGDPQLRQPLGRSEPVHRRADRLGGRTAQDALGRGVEDLDAQVVAVAQDAVRRRIDEVRQPLLAGAQRRLGVEPLDLRAGARGEDAHDAEATRAVPHGPVVEDGEMADDDTPGIEERHPAVAVHAPLDQATVGREELLQALRMMGHLAVQDRLARGPGDRELEVGEERAASPERAGPKAQAVRRQLGDEGVLHAERGRQVLHERGEEPLARLGFDPLDDRPERHVVR